MKGFFVPSEDQFLRPLDEESIKSIEDLNIRFLTWLESEYHRNPHRGIGGSTPLEAWLAGTKYLMRVDPSVDLQRVFYHIQYRKVYKDSTFTVGGVLYEAPAILSGSKIKVYYDPVPERRRVFIESDGKDYGEAHQVDAYANARVFRNKSSNMFAVTEVRSEQESEERAVNNPVRLALDAATFKGERSEMKHG